MFVTRLYVHTDKKSGKEIVTSRRFKRESTNPGFVFKGRVNNARFLVRRVGASDSVKGSHSYHVWHSPVIEEDGNVIKWGKSALNTLTTGISSVEDFVNAVSLNPTSRSVYNRQAIYRANKYKSVAKKRQPKTKPQKEVGYREVRITPNRKIKILIES